MSRRNEGQTEEQFRQFLQALRESLRLVIRIDTGTGDWVTSGSPNVLSDENLPIAITRVEFSSFVLYKNATGRNPANFVSVTLDFRRGSIIDFSNPSGSRTPNDSAVAVSGVNSTWVQGVYQEVQNFFKECATGRDWLHAPHIYDLLLFVVGFPLSFTAVYRINQALKAANAHWPDALFTAFYVYVVLAALMVFRTIFSYARWVYPKVEGPSLAHRGPKTHRLLLFGIVASLLAALIGTIATWVF